MIRKAGKQSMSATVDTGSIDMEARTFEVVFATETPVYRNPYWSDEAFYEVLDCKKSSIRSERLNSGGLPFVDTHDTSTLNKVMGNIVSWNTNGTECRATVQFTKDPAFESIWLRIAEGVIRNISVGYMPWKYVREDQGKDKTPIYRLSDWEPMELSGVPVPADYNSAIRKEDNTHEIEIENLLNTTRMSETNEGTQAVTTETAPAAPQTRAAEPAATPAPVAPANQDAEQQVRSAEMNRVHSIHLAVRNAGLDASFADDFVTRGMTADQARTAIIDEIAKKRNTPNVNGAQPSARGDEGVQTRQAMQEGLMHRAMPGSVKDMDAKAHDYKYMSLLEMARQCLLLKGDRGSYNPNELVKRAIATTDFPDLLSSTQIRFLRQFYNAIVPEWQQFSRQVPANDFRIKTGVKVDGNVIYEELAQDGEYKEMNILQSEKATLQLKTYAKKYSITRQAVINDDLDVIASIPRFGAIGAAQFQSQKVWGLIDNNSNTFDNTALFTSGHKNLAASGAAISSTSVSAARTAMRKQKSPAGNILGLIPKFLIVPPELQTVAEQLVTSIMATATDNVNIWANRLQPVVGDYLTSSTSWYLASDPNASGVDGLVHAYLDGQEGLYTETFIDHSNDKIVTKMRLDFDCALWGFQGWYKNPGA